MKMFCSYKDLFRTTNMNGSFRLGVNALTYDFQYKNLMYTEQENLLT